MTTLGETRDYLCSRGCAVGLHSGRLHIGRWLGPMLEGRFVIYRLSDLWVLRDTRRIPMDQEFGSLPDAVNALLVLHQRHLAGHAK